MFIGLILNMELEQKFAGLFAADVENFANEHGLQVGKCLRGNSGWELTFAHLDRSGCQSYSYSGRSPVLVLLLESTLR